MVTKMSYQNPPIREAVLDIKFNFGQQINTEALQELHSKISDKYTKKEVIRSGQFTFQFSDKGQPSFDATNDGIIGIRCISTDLTEIVQMRVDGFTFSKLQPYHNWEDFITEAKRLLAIYHDFTKPEYANRIAIRYINAIDIKEKVFEVQDYFRMYTTIPESLPKKLLQFFSRVVIQDDGSENMAIINHTVEENTKKIDTTTILFDIDVFLQNIKIMTVDEIWPIADRLKDMRTRIFEGSITDKTRKLFD